MECVFCRIVSGEIPSLKVYEDQDVIAVLDINPANYGHTLVIPKQHHETIFDTPEDLLAKLIAVVKEMAARIKANLQADGVNVIQNNGEAAGQIVKHIHFHVIPRFQGDKVVITYERVQPTPEKMKETMQKLLQPAQVIQDKPAEKQDIPPEEKFGI